jgi:uncharacterized protein (DUF2235 family)
MAKRKTVARERSARTAGERSGNKSIVLFSDGTGNSSAKLFKTNVWRMYEAVDLGPSPRGKRDQIAYYDNGVGTTSFRPLRLLQGAFGWGLKRNVLEIYRYACRNYTRGPGQKPGEDPKGRGDHFYGFGFSRGAFTMRLAIDLIASEGIVAFESERELLRKTKDAYHHYCACGPALGWQALPTQAYRFVAHGLSRLWRKARGIPAYDQARNYRPVVKFIGVWDTVAAYGGPVVEVTRAIDTYVYPLSMPSYKLNPRVQRARHALALDDERDSFQPLLWDEVHEAALTKAGEVAPDRLEQVWFTGMHGDVGGGYPDESLSYVSLLWMLDEAEAAGLRTLDVITERFLALANSFGPIHDSRAGLASYYRYHPRKIAALLDPVDTATLSLRDPAIRDAQKKERGILFDVKVHESVIARVVNGTDDYAPIVLPRRFTIVPPGPTSEAQPQAVSDAPAGCRRAKMHSVSHAVLDARYRNRLARPGIIDRLGCEIEQAWNLVWYRRIVYFLTVIATILLLFLPGLDTLTQFNAFDWSGGKAPVIENLLPSDDREWIGNLLLLTTAYVPEFLRGWIEGMARTPYWMLFLIVVILLLNWLARRIDRALRDRSRSAWDRALGPYRKPTRLAASWIQKVRAGGLYQGLLMRFKWYVLPTVIGLFILFVLAWMVLGIATQIALPTAEAGDRLCQATGSSDTVGRHQIEFHTNRLCHPVGRRVEKQHRYTITFNVGQTWSDARHGTNPLGAGAFDIGPAGPFGLPFRRVVNANYLQPLLEIRDGRAVEIHALDVEPVVEGGTLYRATFEAPRDGELFLFVNDAIFPFRSDPRGATLSREYFYLNNRGTACVTIEAADATGDLPEPPKSSLCAKLAIRDREAAAAVAQGAVGPATAAAVSAPAPAPAPAPASAPVPAPPPQSPISR